MCTVDMRFNNLPEIMLIDPRRYKNPKKGPQHVEPIPLAARPQALSLNNSQTWRVHRVDEVKAAKVAYRIVQKQEAFTQKAIEEQKARDEALGDVEDGQDDSSSLFHASSLGLSGASKGGPSDADSFGVLSFDLSASAFGPPSTGSSMEPTGESVNMSVGAHRQKALHRFKKKDDAYAKAIGGKRILAVAYGHITTILGSINVSDNTTYAEAKELIKPLVAAYCGGETGRKKPPPPAYESSVSSADVAAAQGLDAAERRKAQRAFLREKKKEEAAWTSAQAPPPAAPAALTSAGKVDDTSLVDGGDGAGEDVDYGDTAKPLRNYAEDFTLLRPSGEPIDPVVARYDFVSTPGGRMVRVTYLSRYSMWLLTAGYGRCGSRRPRRTTPSWCGRRDGSAYREAPRSATSTRRAGSRLCPSCTRLGPRWATTDAFAFSFAFIIRVAFNNVGGVSVPPTSPRHPVPSPRSSRRGGHSSSPSHRWCSPRLPRSGPRRRHR